jgi:plastocyanin
MDTRSHAPFTLLISLLLIVGLGMASSVDAADAEIVVKPGTKAFTPRELKIKSGETVTWVNRDQEEHFLTSAGPSSRQVVVGTEDLEIHGLLHPGESYTHTFGQPETYFYFCAIHMQMWGAILVEK